MWMRTFNCVLLEMEQIKNSSNLLGRKREIEELEKNIAAQKKEIEELKTRIKNANLLGKVEFCGFKQGKDLLEEYQYASVFVLPTREDCFGLVLLEAACTGTPIVTSKYADGAYDIITENVNGSIIDPYNAEEFGKTIESILRNPEKYRADKKIFDKFSFESVSKGYVDAIEYTLKDN